MSVSPSKFQQLATKLLGDTFGDFAKDLTLKQVIPAEYPNPSKTASQTGKAIATEVDFRKFDGQLIQQGDIFIITEFQYWTEVKPRTDLSSVVFDGVACQIINYQSDPADANYTIQLRPL